MDDEELKIRSVRMQEVLIKAKLNSEEQKAT